MCVTLCTLEHSVQHNSSTQPQTQPGTMSDSTIRPCLLQKGYGFNNAKPPRAPHRNTMMDVVVFGCGHIQMGKGAAALFIGVHILGKIRLAGGVDTLAESRWEDQIGPSIPVQKINHTTINRQGPLYVWLIGRGTERRPCLWRRKIGGIFNA